VVDDGVTQGLGMGTVQVHIGYAFGFKLNHDLEDLSSRLYLMFTDQNQDMSWTMEQDVNFTKSSPRPNIV
jgi:hypothetical protein